MFGDSIWLGSVAAVLLVKMIVQPLQLIFEPGVGQIRSAPSRT